MKTYLVFSINNLVYSHFSLEIQVSYSKNDGILDSIKL